ncbi:asparagine synthase-domain-containing protein [Infundibulicybe gibba]|nr:asparagine synthase-domain-containing protein [Infundibulicybe gibba]
MCGILFSIQRGSTIQNPLNTIQLSTNLREAISKRGPDAQKAYQIQLNHDSDTHSWAPTSGAPGNQHENLVLDFFVSELQLRGGDRVVQPHEQDGDILCWNGEIFEGLNLSPEENDGVTLLKHLHELEEPAQIRDYFATIEGPYAFVYYRSASQHLYFGRDPLGRRSLLIHKPDVDRPYFLLTSVSAGQDPQYNLEELSTQFIYCLNLKHIGSAQDFISTLISCIESTGRHSRLPGSHRPFAIPNRVNIALPPTEFIASRTMDPIPGYLEDAVDGLIRHLDHSVMLRVSTIPLTVGANSRSRLAVLFSGGIDSTIIAFMAHKYIPMDEPIDLLNVAFENPRKILLQTEGNLGGMPKGKKRQKVKQGNPPVASEKAYMVPDRVTGLQELEELQRLCPGRTWNFVEVNVPFEESQSMRSTIEALMLPGRTIMDMSLALALYFASRGVGQIRGTTEAEARPYSSPARVLLNGLGSDELLGGYGRHRTAFEIGGWEGVIEELQLELDRIPVRNLGRDDRVISSNGKETRHPFLALTVVNFLANLPVHLKMDPRLEVGMGDKLLLRLAVRKLGLVEASRRKKRAMQFGSHSARMGGEKRGDVDLE